MLVLTVHLGGAPGDFQKQDFSFSAGYPDWEPQFWNPLCNRDYVPRIRLTMLETLLCYKATAAFWGIESIDHVEEDVCRDR